MTLRVPPSELFVPCDPDQFEFSDTSELAGFGEIVGQDRAVEAVRFGVEIQHPGFNLFAMGPSGIGKHYVISRFLRERAAQGRTPSDWCYVHNFADPQAPRAIELASGRAREAREQMDGLIDDVEAAVRIVFDGDDFNARKRAILIDFDRRQEEALHAISDEARSRGLALTSTGEGWFILPVVDGEIVELDDLDVEDAERAALELAREELGAKLRAVMDEVPRWERERRNQLRELAQSATAAAIGELFEVMQERFDDAPELVAHLRAVEQAVVNEPTALLRAEDDAPLPGGPRPVEQKDVRDTFRVNLLVDHADTEGAPVVYEDDPTLENLLGRVEHVSRFGALETSHALIRPGALHRANGGFLVVDARKLLADELAWEQLKRALYSNEIRVGAAQRAFGPATTLTLDPEPIPLAVKVVLVGERHIYYTLREMDPDMDELFKVAADFELDMPRTPENTHTYARLIAGLARRDALSPLTRDAVARVVEFSSRAARDSERLSTHMRSIADLLGEADYWARRAGAKVVERVHLEAALAHQEQRNGRIRDQLADQIRSGMVVLRTDGAEIGQVNGLSVIEFGQSAFGRPTRITATVSVGSGDVVDIEREVDLGGPIHSKGMLILKGFLSSRYARECPLSLSAGVVFEQSYGPVDGDSASLAEACALLSAVGGLPLRQGIALTGAIDQRGGVHAVGGVNEKIEGFYDVCCERGLDGSQGVIIPRTNVSELMLKQEVVDAVEAGDFAVYAVRHLDEAMELLTGLEAGVRAEDGEFPAASVNASVERGLRAFATARLRFSTGVE